MNATKTKRATNYTVPADAPYADFLHRARLNAAEDAPHYKTVAGHVRRIRVSAAMIKASNRRYPAIRRRLLLSARAMFSIARQMESA